MFAKSFASNGESAIVSSLATVAQADGSSESVGGSGLYLDTRTSSGWKLSSMNPPSSRFVGQVPVSVEADDGYTLWEQHTQEQPASRRDLYLRLPSGVFTPIGPASPPSPSSEESSNVMLGKAETIAATHDYSHVILETSFANERWPFDETEGNEAHSLYEYSGTNNIEPVLIDVTGEKGSQHLIGLCGSTLGAGFEGSVNSYNAVSANGEAIFMTVAPCKGAPATAEIYARLHGALMGVAPAETVDVSASNCTTECGSTESGKNFEGASEDGSRVYFTSTQKLTNEAVDGVESGNAAAGGGCAETTVGDGGCNLYLYDFAAPSSGRLRTVSVAGEVAGVADISEDGSRAYYVSRIVIPGVRANPAGNLPASGLPNLYVYDAITGKTAFVATLQVESSDHLDWTRINRRPVEVVGSSGQYLLFASVATKTTADDTSMLPQLFEYKAENVSEEPELVRVSKGEEGFNDDGNAVIGVVPEEFAFVDSHAGRDFKTTTNRLVASADGSTVFFSTAGQLSQRATSAANTCRSLYEFHTDGRLANGIVHLVSDGHDTQLFKGALCGIQFQAVDATGSNVLFTTGDPLVPTDTDGHQYDIYDARVDGGFGPSPAGGACGVSLCAEVVGVGSPSLPGRPQSLRNPGEENSGGSLGNTATVKHKHKNSMRVRKRTAPCHRSTSRRHKRICRGHTSHRGISVKRAAAATTRGYR